MSERVEELLDEVVRLIVMSLRQGMESQAQAILALSEAGLEVARIADLLGTTPATVRAAIHKANKKPASAKAGR